MLDEQVTPTEVVAEPAAEPVTEEVAQTEVDSTQSEPVVEQEEEQDYYESPEEAAMDWGQEYEDAQDSDSIQIKQVDEEPTAEVEPEAEREEVQAAESEPVVEPEPEVVQEPQAEPEPVKAAEPQAEAQPQVSAEQARAQYFQNLVGSYGISDELATQVLEEPKKVLPQLLASVQMKSEESMTNRFNQVIPDVVRTLFNEIKTNEEDNTKFFGMYPTLKGNADLVQKLSHNYKSMFPNATKEQAMQAVGAQAIIALGGNLNDIAPNAGLGGAQQEAVTPGGVVSQRVVPPQPEGPGVSDMQQRQVAPSPSLWEEMLDPNIG